MGNKTKKGKGRLDKFYHIAKEQGYRSRASFKLIQLNKKYQFLNNAQVVIDLCAAPGGWLQVVAQQTPHTSIKIGIDLDKIKPIPGCLTFVEDITTKTCVQLIKDQLVDKRADVVLNDGAPNVGANWSKDAFVQVDLCLQALKLACIVLKPGGVFITKIFRSNDYNSFIWVCNQFFGRVEANKPQASRFSSAEIFVVCQDYLAPDIIDQKLFESIHVFKETEGDALKKHLEGEINSLDKIFEKRKKRGGYSDDTLMTMTKSIDFQVFLDLENPFSVFAEYNAITITKEQEEKYYKLVPPFQYFDEYIQDIRVLGKREVSYILKYRQQILNKLIEKKKRNREAENAQQEIQEEREINQDEDQDSQESQIENQILQAQQREFKQMKKDREKKIAQSAKRQHDVAFGGDIEDMELFNLEDHKKLKNLAYVDLEEPKKEKKFEQSEYTNNFELEENLEEMYEGQKLRKQIKLEKQKETSNKRHKNRDFDEDKLKCERMEDGEEEENQRKPSFEIVKEEQNVMDEGILDNKKWFNRNLFNDIKNGQQDKKFKNPLKKDNNVDEEENTQKKAKKQQSKYDDSFSSSGMDEEFEEPRGKKNAKKQQQQDSDDDYVDLDDDQSDANGEKDIFVGDYDQNSNSDIYIDKKQSKLSKKLYGKQQKIDKNEKLPGELSDDDEYNPKKMFNLAKSDMELRREKLKSQRDKIDPKKEQIRDDGFEIVPEKTMEDYNIESLAETLAIAKKMLRKRNQEDILESTYSRYATEDQEDLPDWFVEDEKKHNFKHLPVTKEQVAAEKERLLAINARAPKKILEAKMRNKRRLEKKLKKVKQKSSAIMESEGMNENIKIRQVAAMYKKTIKDDKPTKRYVLGNKSKNTGPVKNKGSRHVKYVDKRLKKDVRSEKRVNNRMKNGIQQSKKRQRVRHKNRKQKS